MTGAVKSLFSPPDMPKVPTPKPVAMPTLDDPARLARIRNETIARSKRGRRGTIFQGSEQGMGSTPTYVNQTLGGAS